MMGDAPETIWIDAWGGNWSPVAGGTQGIKYRRASLPVTEEATASLSNAQALANPKVQALLHALVVWDAAYRTGKNEPLVHAFETGKDALAALAALENPDG